MAKSMKSVLNVASEGVALEVAFEGKVDPSVKTILQ